MTEGTAAGSRTRPSLLLRIRESGDHEAWGTFVDTYGPLIYRYARRGGLQDADAADVTQKVLAQVARSIAGFEYAPEKGRFRDWLGTITRHEIGRFFKRQSRIAQGRGGDGDERLESLASDTVDSAWTEEFQGHICQTALERIRPEFDAVTWRTFLALWLDDRTPQDVAREVQRPVSWVYKAKCRALKRLKEAVQELADDSVLLM